MILFSIISASNIYFSKYLAAWYILQNIFVFFKKKKKEEKKKKKV